MRNRKSAYDEIRKGLEEFKRNKGSLKRYEFSDPDVRSIRESMELSQSEFATLMAVSVRTLQNWEQGHRAPTGAAKTLLRVMESAPQAVIDAIHPEVIKRSKRSGSTKQRPR